MFKLARKFAYVGIAIGVGVSLLWWYVQIFDPFHLPTVGHVPPNYSAPPLYWIINDRRFRALSWRSALPGVCPGNAGIGSRGSCGFWQCSSSGPIYYVIRPSSRRVNRATTDECKAEKSGFTRRGRREAARSHWSVPRCACGEALIRTSDSSEAVLLEPITREQREDTNLSFSTFRKRHTP